LTVRNSKTAVLKRRDDDIAGCPGIFECGNQQILRNNVVDPNHDVFGLPTLNLKLIDSVAAGLTSKLKPQSV
jgi:hypothetical protein